MYTACLEGVPLSTGETPVLPLENRLLKQTRNEETRTFQPVIKPEDKQIFVPPNFLFFFAEAAQ